MLTAFLTEVMGSGSVRLTANGHHVATYPVPRDDVRGSVTAAARAVLAAHGWRQVAAWDQVSGGITGGEWVAHFEQAEES